MSEDPNRAEYDERLLALEADVRDLALLFKHLVDSSPHGEQLVFASLGRIEEQDEAVLKFKRYPEGIAAKKRSALSNCFVFFRVRSELLNSCYICRSLTFILLRRRLSHVT